MLWGWELGKEKEVTWKEGEERKGSKGLRKGISETRRGVCEGRITKHVTHVNPI